MTPISSRELIAEMGGIEKAADQFAAWDARRKAAAPHATVEAIYRIEPRLETLYRAIPKLVVRGQSSRSWSTIKQKFSRLVGWECENPNLASSADYDLIYRVFLAEAERCE